MKFDFTELDVAYIFESLWKHYNSISEEIKDTEIYLKKDHPDKFNKVVKGHEGRLKILKLDRDALVNVMDKIKTGE